ncbi:M20/M25/M40 family metallo-hydrolase [bacterium]|nr:MAG: M20/M25/M40 family metallo-hydrolase [bacterium]
MRLKKLVALLAVSLQLFSCQKTHHYAERPPYDSLTVKMIAEGMKNYPAYDMLYELSVQIGPRLSGSPEAARAVEWGRKKMEELGFDNVRLEPVTVPHWVRGKTEELVVVKFGGMPIRSLTICALGGSICTSKEGITAEAVEVQSFEELHALGDKVKGKIVFYNRPMDRTKFFPGEAYGGAVDQRSKGAMEAGKMGAAAVIVRSMTTRLDDVPHTGAMNYVDSIPKIPAAAISTVGAEALSEILKKEPFVKVRIKMDCEILPDVESANVVGELRGSSLPNEIILIGGHLDSWDKGHGAHDDGAGVVQCLEAIRLLKAQGLRPKRTIRVVLFMNEENGLRGGKAYAKMERPNEKHIAAIETDAGGFSPRAFTVDADSLALPKIAKWAYVLAPLEADKIVKGHGGADISELKKLGVPTIGLRPDWHRYFDYHHSDLDTIDKVNERELEAGAVAMAIMSYVLAEEGI